jgi:Ca2+-binding EF-hand superfamily protein
LEEAILLLPPSAIAETDNKILEQLFVMHDRNFSNTADYKDLLVSFTFMITGGAKDKLLYAFTIYDEEDKGGLTSGDLRKILHCLNITAMYFGDPGLTELNIKEILHDIFLHSKIKTAPLEYMGFIDELVDHEVVKKFLGGWGNAKFGDSAKNS